MPGEGCFDGCVYRILDSAWTQRADGVSLRPDEGSVQADSRRHGFALQVERKAGSRNLGPTATDQCAPTTGAEKAAPQQYRSFSVCLALSLVPPPSLARLRLSGRRRSFDGTTLGFEHIGAGDRATMLANRRSRLSCARSLAR